MPPMGVPNALLTPSLALQDFRRLLRQMFVERPIPARHLIQGSGNKARLCALSAAMMRVAQLLQALNPKKGRPGVQSSQAVAQQQKDTEVKAAIRKATEGVASTLEVLKKAKGIGGFFNRNAKLDLSQGIGGGQLPEGIDLEALASQASRGTADDRAASSSALGPAGSDSSFSDAGGTAKSLVWSSKLADLQLRYSALSGQSLRVLRLDLALQVLREINSLNEFPWGRENLGIDVPDSMADTCVPLGGVLASFGGCPVLCPVPSPPIHLPDSNRHTYVHSACHHAQSLHHLARPYLQPQHLSYVMGLAGGMVVSFYLLSFKDAKEVNRGALAQIRRSMEHAEE